MLIERSEELAAVDDALSGAVAASGRLQLFEGPAGIGKTALLTAARDRAIRAGMLVISARGGELEAGFPYGVVRQLFEPTLRSASRERRQRLLTGAAALGAPAVFGPDPEGDGVTDPTFAVVHGLYWLAANFAAESPLALLVDDLQWSDLPSLRFLLYLARRLDGLAATVIASLRTREGGSDPDIVSGLRAVPGARIASPTPLSDSGVASMLAAEFGQPPDPEFAEKCRDGQHVTYTEVLYEDLVDDPEPHLARLCEFIGLEFDPVMLSSHLSAATRLRELGDLADIGVPALARRAIHARVSSPISSERVGRWRAEMTQSERDRFQAIAGNLLAELGYGTEEARLP